MNFVIAEIIAHGAAVKELHLRREDGAPLAPWQPGSHIVLKFAGPDGAAYENHYSLVGAPLAADSYRIAVLREENGKGGSRCLHTHMAAGMAVDVDGPFDGFPLAPAASAIAGFAAPHAPRTVLVAGGIGITPLVSMAHALSARGAPFDLHYLVSSRDRLALLDEVQAIDHARVVVHVSGDTGRVDLGSLLGDFAAGDSVYACGPSAMLQALEAAAAQRGWPAGAVHVESFGARVQQDDAALTIELTLSDFTLEVKPGTTILDALIAAHVMVSYDCKRGECGSCYVDVLEGEAQHRDVCLTPAQRAQGMCTCVSWGKGKLVLEL